jgi:DNA-directed RNA polymerase specialized sigma24 family protein
MNPEEFDAFYKDARARLLLQTFALTGDLAASRSAVRDAFVVAWHHWRKVHRHPEPESWVRPVAWSHAQRRHTARIWHRDKHLEPEAAATLDALGKLSTVQRKALVLTHLSSVTMEAMARELGLPRADAERELQAGSAQFAIHRDVATTQVRALFEPLRDHVNGVSWPRATIIRRSGAARRRTHTLVGAVVAVAATVASGVLVTDAAGVRPTLAGETSTASTSSRADEPAPDPPPEAPEAFSADVLLSASQVAAQMPGRGWSVTSTGDNTEGDGIVMPCQETRFADPKGRATWVRTFERPGGDGGSAVVQTAELSAGGRDAQRAYDAAVTWFAGCLEPRVQLLTTHEVRGVGDEARLLVLRDWRAPASAYVVGVARTGLITTVTLSRGPVASAPGVEPAGRLLAEGISALCRQPDAGSCARRVRLVGTPPVPVGSVPGMLSEVDLPPVADVTRPWVGTEARKAVDNDAATGCDQTSFAGGQVSHNLTRTFVIPGGRLPAEFGITQTVGTLRTAKAQAFVAEIRDRMAACPDKDLGSDVVRVAHRAAADRDLSVWHVKTEISDEETVSYLMGVVREGTAVSQIGFVPAPDVALAPGDFIRLVERAGARLPAMPRPS